MAQQNLGQKRTIIHCSSSISNWHEKILKRYKAEDYKWWKHQGKHVTFFGLYRPMDFLCIFFHRGQKTIHWQGSDILAAGWHYRWLQKIKAKHICENEVEQGVLRLMLQQEVEVRPTFLSNPNEFKISYKQSNTPHVWLHVNRKAERESGLEVIKRISKKLPTTIFHVYGKVSEKKQEGNVRYHGFVSEAQFNEEIKNYQAGIRLHVFDGMSEVISKSILLGQYPISYVRYPFVATYKDEEELTKLLKDLKNKKKPNYKARNYYLAKFNG